MAYLVHAGARLWFEARGRGPPVVLCGGFGLLHRQWDRVRPLLLPSCRVIDWHPRGSGRSDREWPGNDYSLERWTDDLAAILEHLDESGVVLWGTANGSRIAIRYAAQHPQRVRALITYPGFRTDPAGHAMLDLMARTDEVLGHSALALIASWLGMPEQRAFTPAWARLARWEAEIFEQHLDSRTIRRLLESYAVPDQSDDLRRLTVPTLLLLGGSGRLGYGSPRVRAMADAFIQLAPLTSVASIAGAGGTYCMLERPHQTAIRVLRFIRSLPATC